MTPSLAMETLHFTEVPRSTSHLIKLGLINSVFPVFSCLQSFRSSDRFRHVAHEEEVLHLLHLCHPGVLQEWLLGDVGYSIGVLPHLTQMINLSIGLLSKLSQVINLHRLVQPAPLLDEFLLLHS